MSTIALSPAHQAFLDATFTRNRALYAGWSMDGSGSGGGSGGDGGSGGSGGDGGGNGSGGSGGDSGGSGGGGAGGGKANATDAQGNDLGFPKDTPVAEMSDKEQAAYWRNNSRKHEGRYKGLVGDRTPEQVKADLEAAEEAKRAQMTPSEKALDEARAAGKAEAQAEAATKSAQTVFRGALEANGITGDDLDELVSTFNVTAFIGDDGVDTTKITNFAKRFSKSDTDNNQQRNRQRDFGGGNRNGSGGGEERGAGGKAEAARRFGTK